MKKAERKGQLSVLFHYVLKLYSCKDETFQKIEHKLKLILKASKILNGAQGHSFSFSIMVLKILVGLSVFGFSLSIEIIGSFFLYIDDSYC